MTFPNSPPFQGGKSGRTGQVFQSDGGGGSWEAGVRSLESGVWSLESGVWSLESGVWSLEESAFPSG